MRSDWSNATALPSVIVAAAMIQQSRTTLWTSGSPTSRAASTAVSARIIATKPTTFGIHASSAAIGSGDAW